MPDTPYAQAHPTQHGFGAGIKSAFHEIPVWGWYVAAAGSLLVLYLHHKAATVNASTTAAGTSTTAADVTSGGVPTMGDIVGLNNLMVQSEQMSAAEFAALEAQIAALQASVTNQGVPTIPTSGTPPSEVPPSPARGGQPPGPSDNSGASINQGTQGPGTPGIGRWGNVIDAPGGTFANTIHPIFGPDTGTEAAAPGSRESVYGGVGSYANMPPAGPHAPSPGP